MVNTQGDPGVIDTVLELTTQAMGGNDELIHGPAHDNYVIDDVTARLWAKLDNPTNVDQKFQEALSDVEHMPFASEEDRDVVLGEILDHMTWVARNTSQYVKVIAYHDAGNAVAGTNRDGAQYNKCFAYYQMHLLQQAVDECTLLIDTHRGSIRARYYRAWANGDLKNYDAAIEEYADIAENGSDNYIRAGAVINLDHMYSLQGKYSRELEVFDKYPFVFDTQIQTEEDLAMAYNNRCFVYMKLGELNKALEDCRMSLKYGRLPDALQKQQQLQKLLSAQTT